VSWKRCQTEVYKYIARRDVAVYVGYGKQNYQELGVEAELNFEFFEFYHYIF